MTILKIFILIFALWIFTFFIKILWKIVFRTFKKTKTPEERLDFKSVRASRQSPVTTSELAENQDDEGRFATALMVAASLGTAVLAYGVFSVRKNDGSWRPEAAELDGITVLLSIAIGLAYPIVGAISVKIAATLRRFAYASNVKDWSRGTILWLALAWPATLFVSFCVYPFLFVIKRLF